ncbi:MAG: hypothetical protein J5506_10620 [Prevotella sp.]|nr:hypothetical protein [Prevotella sp.]
MDEIKVMQKPDWVSWDDIHELILTAHKKNIEKGVVMNTTTMSGEELKNYIGENGRCFVAFCGDTLVGTTSVRIATGKRWYDKDKTVAKGMMSAIIKKYQGLGILEEMNELRDVFVAENNVQMLEGDTAENNTALREIVAKKGFKEVRFFPAYYQKHYSVEFVKWLGECPFTDRHIRTRFILSRVLTKMRFKPGRIERSRYITKFCKKADWYISKMLDKAI